MRRVTMYSRVRCGLCDEAREAIFNARLQAAFDYEEIVIDGRDDLEREYGIRVPVVLLDGQEVFEIRVDPGRLVEAVRLPNA